MHLSNDFVVFVKPQNVNCVECLRQPFEQLDSTTKLKLLRAQHINIFGGDLGKYRCGEVSGVVSLATGTISTPVLHTRFAFIYGW